MSQPATPKDVIRIVQRLLMLMPIPSPEDLQRQGGEATITSALGGQVISVVCKQPDLNSKYTIQYMLRRERPAKDIEVTIAFTPTAKSNIEQFHPIFLIKIYDEY